MNVNVNVRSIMRLPSRAFGVLRRTSCSSVALAATSSRVARSGVRVLSTQPSSSRRPLPQSDFHELRERSLLQYVIAKSTEGEPESVTEAMDVFWDTYFNGEGTAQWKLRVKALDDAISAKTPRTAMEIGTYCGYTAVRMGRHVPPGGKLISVEMDPLYAAIATKIIEHAGLRDRVFVEIGTVKDRLAAIQKKYSLSGSLDAVLLDHDVNSYLPDLKRLEAEGLITKGTVVLCDWSLYPGSDDYGRPLQVPTDGKEFMTYLAQAGRPTATHTLTGKEVFTVSSWTGVV